MTEEKSFLSTIKKWFSQDDVLPEDEAGLPETEEDLPKTKASPRKARPRKTSSRKASPRKAKTKTSPRKAKVAKAVKASPQTVKKTASQKGKRKRDRSKRLVKAYSIELGRNVTAQEADNLCNKNDKDAKLKFRCPEQSCKASVTCANMDTPTIERRRAVYFVAIDDHAVGCKLRVK